jgi:glycerophosphoryl diester phosphodiesterase
MTKVNHPLLDPSARPIVGHRGNAAHAPENTLESFRQAIALGVDAIELDVRLTADGAVVVMHDPTVDRTTTGTGAVADLALGDIRRFDAGARFTRDGGQSFPYRDKRIGVPTFAEVLETFPDTRVLIEIKTPTAAAATRTLIESHDAVERCIVDAFDPASLVPFRRSRIAIGASQSDVKRLLARALVGQRPAELPYRVMCIPRAFRGVPLPIAAMVRSTARSGCLVHVWTINEPRVAQSLWRAGVRGIITDDPATMLRLRAESSFD